MRSHGLEILDALTANSIDRKPQRDDDAFVVSKSILAVALKDIHFQFSKLSDARTDLQARICTAHYFHSIKKTRSSLSKLLSLARAKKREKLSKKNKGSLIFPMGLF